MIRSAPLGAVAAGRLLWAAALFDAGVVFLLMQVLGVVVRAALGAVAGDTLGGFVPGDPDLQSAAEVAVGLLGYLVLLIMYWAVCEILLGGRSLGRFCLMMRLRQKGGGAPRLAQITRRGLLKILSLGLAGLNFGGPPRYDVANNLAWESPLAAGRLTAMRGWRVQVLSGRFAGKAFTLERLEGFERFRAIRIGRDPNWSDIVLDREESVSLQHAVLSLRNGRWRIQDYGGGAGSSNRTYLGGDALPPKRWVVITPPADFSVANVRMRLSRD